MEKENPNPVIHATHRRSNPSHSSPSSSLVGASVIRRYYLGSPPPPTSLDGATDFEHVIDDNALSQWVGITAEDRSVALALSAAAYPSEYDNRNRPAIPSAELDSSPPKLGILHQAGFALFHPQHIQNQCKAIRYPSYSPYVEGNQEQGRDDKRDAITVNEIFNIIRNIQDPEHPLTLEQLNVVRDELIEVVDRKGDDADGDDGLANQSINGCAPKKFSTVHVQFT